MLKHLRNKTVRNNIFIGLAVIIILSLALPVFILDGDSEQKRGDRAGTINGKNVTVQDLLASYNAVRHQAQFMYGDQFEKIQTYLNFEKEAWDRLLLLDYAKREKIRVVDSEVVKWIGDQQVFTREGRFDSEFYRLYVDRFLRSTPRRFEEEIRELLMISKIGDRVRSAVTVSDQEVRTSFERQNATRDLEYGFLSAEKLLSDVKVNDSEIERIFPLLQSQLTSPSRVKISYLFIPKENTAAMKITVDEKIGLEEAVKKSGIALRQTGFFSKKDPVAEIGPRPEVLGEAFRLKEAGESGWIHTEAGSYKIRVDASEAGRPLTLEESRDSIRQMLARDSAAQAAVKKLRDLKPTLTTPSFGEALKAAGADVKSLSGLKAGGSILEAPGGEQAIDKALKDTPEGGITDVIAVPTGGLIAMVLKEYPGDAQEFEKLKTELKSKVVDEKAAEGMKKLLEDLRKGLKENTELMNTIFKRETPEASSTPA